MRAQGYPTMGWARVRVSERKSPIFLGSWAAWAAQLSEGFSSWLISKSLKMKKMFLLNFFLAKC